MSKRTHLPILDESAPSAHVDPRLSSIGADGRRQFVYTADVRGRFHSVRRVVFAVLVAVMLALPVARVGGHPLILLDVEHRRFFLFGLSFNAQDAYLAFFAVTAGGFLLAVVSSLWGRLFCGFACPQTVFLDGLFRPIERLVEGSREQRMRRDHGPWSAGKVARKLLKHGLFLVAALAVAHVALSFFVSVPDAARMVIGSPSEHPEAFAWTASVTMLLYGNFAWFREQFCVVLCPYGRLQSILMDEDTLTVGYDEKRGEPRGKVKEADRGACIDCKRCVAVCPTGIDIRNGLQLDCIGCTACIDACDEIMDKVGQPRGLIRLDSQRGFDGRARRFWRPRVFVYVALGVLGVVVATFVFSRRTGFEATVVRAQGAPYVVDGERVRNSYVIHLVNKADVPAEFSLQARGADIVSQLESVEVEAMSDTKVPIVVSTPIEGSGRWTLVVRRTSDGEFRELNATIVGPSR